MQTQFKERWRRGVTKTDDTVTLGDFGFYDPDGIGDWADAYIASGYDPGHLPRPGGLRNQTVADRHDLALYMRGVEWAKAMKDNPEQEIAELLAEGYEL